MNFGHPIDRKRKQSVSGIADAALLLSALAVLLCAGCSSKPDSAPVPPGPPMTPAQVNAVRVDGINNDSRLTPLQKQQAIERLQGQAPSSPPVSR